MATQLDIIRSQAASAARNASARARSELRRETSLVNQASRWAGRAAAQGEAALRGRGGGRRGSPPAGAGRSETPRPAPRCSPCAWRRGTGGGRCCGARPRRR